MVTIKNALGMFDFDIVLIPINVSSLIVPRTENDFMSILKIAKDRDIGVVAIKVILKRR